MIVVIAILAAISIVAYNGIKQRSTNMAIIAGAKQTVGLIASYKATYGQYPLGAYCLTTDNKCTNYMGTVLTNDNTVMITELSKIGKPLQSVPKAEDNLYGIYFDGYQPRTFNHAVAPGLVMYWLKGEAQSCQLPNVAVGDPAPLPGEQNAYISATNAWTVSGSGRTTCYISV